MALTWEAVYVILVLIGTFGCLIKGFRTPEIIFFGALILCWNATIISTEEAVAGFSNTGLLTVGVLNVVIKGVEKSGAAGRVCRKAFGAKTSFRMGMLRMQTLCFAISGFFNNTPIVALLIPITRDWARQRGFAPSHFLIPLSYSAIFGGVLTIIGTSTNLLVNGLLEESGREGFTFFQPAYVGAPLGVFGICYCVLLSQRLLPIHGGLFRVARDRAGDMVTEIEVLENFAYAGQSIEYICAKLNLAKETIIKLRRPTKPETSRSRTVTLGGLTLSTAHDQGYTNRTSRHWGTMNDLELLEFGRQDSSNNEARRLDESPETSEASSDGIVQEETKGEVHINENLEGGEFHDFFPVSEHQTVYAGDILFITCQRQQLLSLAGAGAMEGINLLNSSALDLPGYGTEYFELVLSNQNRFVGSLFDMPAFSQYYSCSVLAYRRRAQVSQGDDIVGLIDIKKWTVMPGDVVLILAKDSFYEAFFQSSDFFLVSQLGAHEKPVGWFDYIPSVLFVIMLAIVAADLVDILQASMTAAVVFTVVGWVDAKKAADYVDWRLLLLIGSALGVSSAISNSGLAQSVADAIASADIGPQAALFVLFVFTLICTELVTNNAAAALGVPIALTTADALEVNYQPLAMAVMIAASMSFITPIGYQTNTMVWGPGGYKFGDYVKIGAPLSILNMIFACFFIPIVFPFS